MRHGWQGFHSGDLWALTRRSAHAPATLRSSPGRLRGACTVRRYGDRRPPQPPVDTRRASHIAAAMRDPSSGCGAAERRPHRHRRSGLRFAPGDAKGPRPARAGRDRIRERHRPHASVQPLPRVDSAGPVHPQPRHLVQLGPGRRLPRLSEAGSRAVDTRHLAAGEGYRTALVGKYFNEYGSNPETARVPPGWDSGTPCCEAATTSITTSSRTAGSSTTARPPRTTRPTSCLGRHPLSCGARRSPTSPSSSTLRPAPPMAPPPRLLGTRDSLGTRGCRGLRPSTRRTSATSRGTCARAGGLAPTRSGSSMRTTATGSGRCRQWTTWSPTSSRPCGRPGHSTIPTSSSSRTTVTCWANTGAPRKRCRTRRRSGPPAHQGTWGPDPRRASPGLEYRPGPDDR